MLFSSLIFLFRFLPLTLLGYYALTALAALHPGSRRAWRHAANALLLVASLVFYAWGEPKLTIVMLGVIAAAFAGGLGVERAQRKAAAAGRDPAGAGRAALVGTLVVCLGLLAFFKYGMFGVANYNALVEALGLGGWQARTLEIALPLGISFYTFQALSYTIDVYRRQVPATHNVIDFACYVTMFPQLVAGPIVRYVDIAREAVERVHTRRDAASGAMRFATGLAKKVLIANTVAVPADAIFGLEPHALTTAHAWLGVVCYTLQIYFDFSAYSDMAIGLGRMMGFHFVENFDYPYVARSNQEFWRRWHISLSTWFRDYVYIPLGGNRGSPFRTYRNLLLVFFLCGLWHGASWSFVVWGLYHGVFLILERGVLGALLGRLPRVLQHVYLLLVAMGGWVLFRSDSLAQAGTFFAALAGAGAGDGSPVHFLDPRFVATAVVAVVLCTPVAPAVGRWWTAREAAGVPHATAFATVGAIARPVLVGTLLVLCAAVLSSGTHNPFIYFRF